MLYSNSDFPDRSKAEIWRWRHSGEAMVLTNHDLDKNSAMIFDFLRRHGGTIPRDRARSSRGLSLYRLAAKELGCFAVQSMGCFDVLISCLKYRFFTDP